MKGLQRAEPRVEATGSAPSGDEELEILADILS